MARTPFQRPWLIAHRGARDQAPENTAAAFEKALSYPIDGIELDVQMTADGVPVLYHDWTLARVGGGKKRIWRQSYAQLRKLDFGSWFDPGYAGEPLLTLDELLARFGGRTRLLIEIKSHPAERDNGHAYRLTAAVMDLLDRHARRLGDQTIYLLSFDPEVLRRAAGSTDRWRYVLNLSEKKPKYSLESGAGAVAGLWAVCAAVENLSFALIDQARRRGLRLLTYTCNSDDQVACALRVGVDGIMSDKPGWLTRIAGLAGRGL